MNLIHHQKFQKLLKKKLTERVQTLFNLKSKTNDFN